MGLRRRLGVVIGVDPNNRSETPKSSLKSPQGRDPSKHLVSITESGYFEHSKVISARERLQSPRKTKTRSIAGREMTMQGPSGGIPTPFLEPLPRLCLLLARTARVARRTSPKMLLIEVQRALCGMRVSVPRKIV
jgi:hypothetical protein